MDRSAILWRRLDTAGHDACRLVKRESAWRLEGTAVFLHENLPACLAYEVDCDGRWRTTEGKVRGWIGSRLVDFLIRLNDNGVWTVNGREVPAVAGCIDLDFGFTPATNLFQLRRAALQVSQSIDIDVAWLDPAAGTLNVLHQRYERQEPEVYWYEAPRFGYSAALEVSSVGFVRKYPDLWESEQ